jgi:hypothetical protein
VAPAQRLSAAELASRDRHRRALLARCGACPPPGPPQPVQLCGQRPGAVLQVLQVAVAVEGPAVAAARPAAPVAGLRGARTGVVGPRPARASAAPVNPRAGQDADLPGPARCPAAHEPSPPLAWLPGSDQPAEQAGTAKPEPHRARPPYSPAVGPAGHGVGAAGGPKAQRPAHPPPWRSRSPRGELRSKGRASEAGPWWPPRAWQRVAARAWPRRPTRSAVAWWAQPAALELAGHGGRCLRGGA